MLDLIINKNMKQHSNFDESQEVVNEIKSILDNAYNDFGGKQIGELYNQIGIIDDHKLDLLLRQNDVVIDIDAEDQRNLTQMMKDYIYLMKVPSGMRQVLDNLNNVAINNYVTINFNLDAEGIDNSIIIAVCNLLRYSKISSVGFSGKSISADWFVALLKNEKLKAISCQLNSLLSQKDFEAVLIALSNNYTLLHLNLTQNSGATFDQHINLVLARNKSLDFINIKRDVKILFEKMNQSPGTNNDRLLGFEEAVLIYERYRNGLIYLFDNDYNYKYSGSRIKETLTKWMSQLESLVINQHKKEEWSDVCFDAFESIYMDMIINNSKHFSFITALMYCSTHYFILLSQFKDPDHQKIFDMLLLNSINSKVGVGDNGFKVLDSPTRLRFLQIALAKWNPVEHDEIQFKVNTRNQVTSLQQKNCFFGTTEQKTAQQDDPKINTILTH